MSARWPHPTAPGAGGFTLLELVVVIALIGLLLGLAATRLLPYIRYAEEVSVLRIEGQLKNVLVMEAAQRIARGESARLGELDRANPMTFLLEPPRTYVGELSAPRIATLPRRSWYFDADRRRLVYRAGRGYEAPGGEPAVQEYAVRIRYDDRNGDRRFTPGVDEFHGVRLERTGPAVVGA